MAPSHQTALRSVDIALGPIDGVDCGGCDSDGCAHLWHRACTFEQRACASLAAASHPQVAAKSLGEVSRRPHTACVTPDRLLDGLRRRHAGCSPLGSAYAKSDRSSARDSIFFRAGPNNICVCVLREVDTHTERKLGVCVPRCVARPRGGARSTHTTKGHKYFNQQTRPGASRTPLARDDSLRRATRRSPRHISDLASARRLCTSAGAADFSEAMEASKSASSVRHLALCKGRRGEHPSMFYLGLAYTDSLAPTRRRSPHRTGRSGGILLSPRRRRRHAEAMLNLAMSLRNGEGVEARMSRKPSPGSPTAQGWLRSRAIQCGGCARSSAPALWYARRRGSGKGDDPEGRQSCRFPLQASGRARPWQGHGQLRHLPVRARDARKMSRLPKSYGSKPRSRGRAGQLLSQEHGGQLASSRTSLNKKRAVTVQLSRDRALGGHGVVARLATV